MTVGVIKMAEGNSLIEKFRELKEKMYASTVKEMKEFYERRIDFVSNFRLPGYEDEGDAAATTEDSSGSGTGADVVMNVKYEKEINAAAKKYGLNPWFIASIIKQESNFNPTAGSGAGARGLMQLMPATAASLGVKNVTDPGQNVMGGTKYIKDMLVKYDWNPVLALAAYNAGPGNVGKYGGVPPFKETQDYVVKIPNNFKTYTGEKLTSKNVKWQGEMTSSSGSSLGSGAAKDFINKWRISADFPRYPGGGYHSGIDFAGAGILNTPLPCFHAGTVISAGWKTSYGNTVVVRDNSGNYHYYAHLNSIAAKAGQKVAVDTVIGTIGSTGNSTGPHLHYEVRPPNNSYTAALNPHGFLKGTNKA